MKAWTYLLTFIVIYFNQHVRLASGITMLGCQDRWIDITDDKAATITCHTEAPTEKIEWKVENGRRTETFFEGFCFPRQDLCNVTASFNRDMFLRVDDLSETSVVVVDNHRHFGGFSVMCSADNIHLSCTINVINGGQFTNCRTEIDNRSWKVTATCYIRNVFSSNRPNRCEGFRRLDTESGNDLKFNTSIVLEYCTDLTDNKAYQEGFCTFTSDLPSKAGNYTYFIKLLPQLTTQTAGEVTIGESNHVCGYFNQDNTNSTYKCVTRVSGTSSTSTTKEGFLTTTSKEDPPSTVTNRACSTSATKESFLTTTSQWSPSTVTNRRGELRDCKTETNAIFTNLTATCYLDKFSSSDEIKCGGFRRQLPKTQNDTYFDCRLDLENYTDPKQGDIYRRGHASFNMSLPLSAGNYSFHFLIDPGRLAQTAGEMYIDGPTSVKITPDVSRPFVTNGSHHMTLVCTADDVYPAVTYNWSGVTCLNENHTDGTCLFTPRVPQDEGHYVSCTARNAVSHTNKTEKCLIQLKYPPISPPEITGHDVFTEGESVTLTCTVKGGKPKVTSVIFYCGEEGDRPDDVHGDSVSSSVVISVQPRHNNTVCQCSANWVTQADLYPYKSFRRMYVKAVREHVWGVSSSSQPADGTSPSSPSSPSQEKMSLGGIVGGVTAAFVVVIILIICFAVVIKRKRNRPPAKIQNPREENRENNGFDEQINMIYVSADLMDSSQSAARAPLSSPSRCKDASFRCDEVTQSKASNSRNSPTARTTIQPPSTGAKPESQEENTEHYYAVVNDDLFNEK